MSAVDGPVGRREVAYRLFAAEYDDADFEYSDSDEERAPNYVVTPAGARVNRLFAVGVLTEVEPVSDDVLRARVVDPTGAFVVYAGQYQPEAVAFLEDADVPSFVSLTGKARTFQPEGSDRVFSSVRPESITAVDGETRDRWTIQAAEHTLARVATMARALELDERGDALAEALRSAGVAPGLAAGVALAIDHYGTTAAYLSALRGQAIAAAELVAGDRDAVPDLERSPAEEGPVEGELTAAPAVTGTLANDAELAAPSATDPEPTGTAEPDPTAGASGATTVGEDTGPAGAPAEPDGAAAPEPAPADEEVGDFEVAGTDDIEASVGEYELGDAEREEVEAEFGTEFSTGSEVGEPGEAGIEPETEPAAAGPAADVDVEDDRPAEEPDPSAGDGQRPVDPGSAEGAGPEVDLEDAAVDAMAELDDGDGVDRDAVVQAVVEAHGAEAAAVEDAIQEALMGGRCYEPADGTLKAI